LKRINDEFVRKGSFRLQKKQLCAEEKMQPKSFFLAGRGRMKLYIRSLSEQAKVL